MRNRTWSDVVLSLMIAACVAAVAAPQASQSASTDKADASIGAPDVSESARSLAAAVLFDTPAASPEARRTDRAPSPVTASAADRVVANAAEVAGNAARGIEMPFFSFGGDASAE